jgi:hypothetical protein
MRKFLVLPILLVLGAVLFAGCTQAAPNVVDQNNGASSTRAATFARAQAQVPAPVVKNFPRRQTLVDAVQRQALPNHPWYVYVLGQNGNIVSYFVAKSVPVNDCDYLSSAQSVIYDDNGNIVLQSPSLEGIYQGGGACDTLTFFDLTSNSEIQLTGLHTYVSDRPLKVDAQPIKVKVSK